MVVVLLGGGHGSKTKSELPHKSHESDEFLHEVKGSAPLLESDVAEKTGKKENEFNN